MKLNFYSPLAGAAAVVLTLAAPAAQADLTAAQARTAVTPLYTTFTQPVAGDVKTLLEQGTTPDWQSCASEKDCRGRDESVKTFIGYGKAVPNLKHVIKDVVVSGDVVVVRGELSGTPAGDFLGVPHSGRSFNIMTLDQHVVKGGKLAHTYHIEDWGSAMRQLSGK